MHKYLRAIGFSGIKTREQLEVLLKDAETNYTDHQFVLYDNETCVGDYIKEVAPDIGIVSAGEFDAFDNYSRDYYFPYIRGRKISTNESSIVERHTADISFAGVCDDSKVGISIIYYLLNRTRYIMDTYKTESDTVKGISLSLSALAVNGTIMMPLAKNAKAKTKAEAGSRKRNKLLEAARNGDENAIESLTLEDLDIYSSILRKIKSTDVYTLVDTYFMPTGVECDQYSVLGEITELSEVENSVTKERLVRMTISVNEIPIDLCINKEDLYGEPQVGRRFKGNIWLQGYLNYVS